MFDFVTNWFNGDKYKYHSQAVIVGCFFNPQKSPYRLLAFQKWYRSIKHLNHRIIECVINDNPSQLPRSEHITTVSTPSLLWHKESLLNKLIGDLPRKYKYVFWLDADVLFTNQSWLTDSVERLRSGTKILQPFDYCVHLGPNQLKPSFNTEACYALANDPKLKHPNLWRSFSASYVTGIISDSYHRHGHVGFAWGCRREVLDKCLLYDKALVGGSDHILAHAAVGQIPHPCITSTFRDNMDEVMEWSRRFYEATDGKILYTPGELHHIWHGDIALRDYVQRIKDFTKESKDFKKRNGLFVAKKDAYVKNYFKRREVSRIDPDGFDGFDDGFFEDMGYMIDDIGRLFGPPIYDDEPDDRPSAPRCADDCFS